jgi:hypothetical protein
LRSGDVSRELKSGRKWYKSCRKVSSPGREGKLRKGTWNKPTHPLSGYSQKMQLSTRNFTWKNIMLWLGYGR